MDFSDVGTKYRPIPFWSWNDKLECDVLREQIREMHKAGIGGFFMHARGGLKTEYMSEEWMQCVNACLDEAGKLGMDAWLYDENGWPSGFGNGAVNGKGIRFQQKYLRCETILPGESGRENTIAWYTADGEFVSRETPSDLTGEYLRIYFEVNPYYVDNTDPEAVKEFIETTHEYYRKNIPAELMPYLKGVFTDEPQLSRKGFPWSLIFEEEYKKEYGRDLLAELPGLFYDLPGCRGTRVRFFRMTAKFFSQNFMEQVSQWCKEHNWLLTGHHLQEEYLPKQIPANGSVMTQYEHYDIPGMDHLCRNPVDTVTMTQLVSAAMQLGKKQILSESFAMTGWNFNFSGMLWMFNQQLAHGINLLCQHLQGYSLRGLRKRDYPCSSFVHQPWWKDYRRINDHFARAGKLLAEGTARTDVLIIHPVSSGWALFQGNEDTRVIAAYSNKLKNLTETFDAAQIPIHYADGLLTEKYGSADGNIFRIGKCDYKIIIIPELNDLSSDMTKKLMEFSASGGVILKLKNSVEELENITIDGEAPSDDITGWLKSLPEYDSAEEIMEKTASMLTGLVKVSGPGKENILSTRRTFGRDIFYFVTNKSYDRPGEIELSLPGETAYIGVIDNETGKVFRLAGAVRTDGNFIVSRTIYPGEAVMFYLSDDLKEAEELSVPEIKNAPVIRKIASRFTVKDAGEGNIFTLDRCRFRVDGGNWEYNDFCVIHPRLLDLERPCQLEMECDFTLDESFDLDTQLSLVIETPENFGFALNGQSFAGTSCGTLFDQAFHKVRLPENLHHGVNTISMKCLYSQNESVYDALPKARLCETEYNKLVYDSEIENIYLLGDFCVDFTGSIQQLERKAERFCGTFSAGAPLIGRELDCEDTVQNGLPFFAGKLKLETRIELTDAEVKNAEYLRFTPVNANSYKFIINGTETALQYSGRYAVPVKGLLHAGENILELEVTTSLRNMLGPWHLEIGESFAISTLSFNREPSSLRRSIQPYNEDYCFVKLGITDIKII